MIELKFQNVERTKIDICVGTLMYILFLPVLPFSKDLRGFLYGVYFNPKEYNNIKTLHGWLYTANEKYIPKAIYHPMFGMYVIKINGYEIKYSELSLRVWVTCPFDYTIIVGNEYLGETNKALYDSIKDIIRTHISKEENVDIIE